MISRIQSADRKRNQKWQCQAVGLLPDVAGVPTEAHSCVLPKHHWWEHQCWCGTLYDGQGRAWVKKRLPGF